MSTSSEFLNPAIDTSISSRDQRAHVVQFYSEDEFLLDELSRFIGSAVGCGDSAIVIATAAHREGLAKRLATRGLDLSRATEWGRYVALDAAETLGKFMAGGMPDPDQFRSLISEVIERARIAAEGDSSRVVAFGEMVALLWAEGKRDAALRAEQLWNELSKAHALHLRCAYPIDAFNREQHAETFLTICAEHSAVIPGESCTSLPTEQDRHRTISELQQKAQALATEVAERKRVKQELVISQEALRKSHEELETRVASRTRELARAQAHLGELSRKLLSLRDEERRRLARELHDSTGQTLAALELNLVMLQQREDLPASVSERISESIQLVDHALQEIRTISYLLHPPMLDEAGLILALEWYVEGFAQRSRMKIDLGLPTTYERLPQEMELAIFRIVQEALTNVYRHSGSASAQVKVIIGPEQVQLIVEDAGKGIQPETLELGEGSQLGVGIRGMRERARHLGGDLQLAPASPGTRLKVTLPRRKRSN
jgi:signal transduction histidine kinase